MHLGTKYADFQEKNLRGDFWEKVPNFGYYIKIIYCSALLIGGRFPIKIKTEIRYLIICGYHNFMR